MTFNAGGAASSAAANAAAAVAVAAAHRARVSECRAIEASFDARTATVEQKQRYADAIGFLYPRGDMFTKAQMIALRVVVAAMLVATAAGCWHGWQKSGRFDDVFFYGFGGLLTVLVGSIVLAGIVYGMRFVFGSWRAAIAATAATILVGAALYFQPFFVKQKDLTWRFEHGHSATVLLRECGPNDTSGATLEANCLIVLNAEGTWDRARGAWPSWAITSKKPVLVFVDGEWVRP